MHKITCNEADRLARTLDEAEELTRRQAASHAQRADAMAIIGEHLMAEAHRSWSALALDTARELHRLTTQLRARAPLYQDVPTKRAPAARMTRAKAREQRSRRAS